MRQKNIFQIHAVNKLLKIWVISVACSLYRSGKQNLCLIRYFEARLWRWPKHLIGAVGQWNPFTIINHVILQNGADGFQVTRMRKKLCKWWKKRELLFEKINFFFISIYLSTHLSPLTEKEYWAYVFTRIKIVSTLSNVMTRYQNFLLTWFTILIWSFNFTKTIFEKKCVTVKKEKMQSVIIFCLRVTKNIGLCLAALKVTLTKWATFIRRFIYELNSQKNKVFE